MAKDDLPNESMKTDKAMEFDSNKEISDNVGVDSEVQKTGRQKRNPACLADYETYYPDNSKCKFVKRCTIRTSTFEQDGKHVELVEKEWAEICDCMKEYKNKDKNPEVECRTMHSPIQSKLEIISTRG